MGRKHLGIDIQEDALTAVLVSSGLKTSAVDACIQIPLASSEHRSEALAQAFETLHTGIDTDGCIAMVSIPVDKATYRNLLVPFSDSKKIRQVLPFELEPTLPFPVESLVIDFHKINTTEAGTRVLVATAAVTDVQSVLEMTSPCQIDPESVLPGAYATAWWLAQHSDAPESWLLVNLMAHRCCIHVVRDRQICMVRSFPITGPEPAVAQSICRHIQQTMAGMDGLFQTSYLPSVIMMTGPGADSEIIAQQTSEILELPVQQPDLLTMMGTEHKVSVSADWQPLVMNNALAVALLAADGHRGINLRQGALAARSRFLEYRQAMIRTGIVALVALLLFFANLTSELSILKKEVALGNEQILSLFQSTFPEVKNIVDPFKQMQITVNELKEKASGPREMTRTLPAIDMLYALSQQIPDQIDVRINKLVAGDQSVLISGTTDSFNSVNDMKSRLEKNSLFKIVKINSANMDRFGKRVRFKIKINL